MVICEEDEGGKSGRGTMAGEGIRRVASRKGRLTLKMTYPGESRRRNRDDPGDEGKAESISKLSAPTGQGAAYKHSRR